MTLAVGNEPGSMIVGSFGRERRGRAGTTEVGVGVVDAGVDDGDRHALAGVAEVLPRGGDADERHGVRQGLVRIRIGWTETTPGRAASLRHVPQRDADADAVVGVLVLPLDLAAGADDRGLQGVLARLTWLRIAGLSALLIGRPRACASALRTATGAAPAAP